MRESFLRDFFGMPPRAKEPLVTPPPTPAEPSPTTLLIETLQDQIAYLRKLLSDQAQASELREAELRGQLVALVNSNALAVAAYYGPERPSRSGANGVHRIVPPRPTSPSEDDDAPAATRPYDNGLFGEDHLDLGTSFHAEVPVTGPAENQDEDALAEATIERAAKEREAARLGTSAPVRTRLVEEEV